jgi:hypothetical protein
MCRRHVTLLFLLHSGKLYSGYVWVSAASSRRELCSVELCSVSGWFGSDAWSYRLGLYMQPLRLLACLPPTLYQEALVILDAYVPDRLCGSPCIANTTVQAGSNTPAWDVLVLMLHVGRALQRPAVLLRPHVVGDHTVCVSPPESMGVGGAAGGLVDHSVLAAQCQGHY